MSLFISEALSKFRLKGLVNFEKYYNPLCNEDPKDRVNRLQNIVDAFIYYYFTSFMILTLYKDHTKSYEILFHMIIFFK